MNLQEALRRYRANQFTDQDVTRCTDLSQRKWRELIKDKLVRTVIHRPGRGHVRRCDAITLKRTAVIAALNRAGLSLAVSSGVAFFLPFHTALYEVCDPVLLRRAGAGELKTKVHWFDPNRPARAEPESDWRLEIYDGRFVGITYVRENTPVIFGDLRDNGTRFVSWVPSHRKDQFIGCAIEKLAREFGREKFAEAVAAWEDPTRWPHELRALGYGYEQRGEDDPLRTTAAATAKSPLFTTNVNISLAIRKALRRYLGIEPAERESP
jgi:hypothetical protein